MDLNALDLFAAVARRGSFAAVAKERGLNPSIVSRGIADLEARLGVRLFQRTTRSMSLTEVGEIYLTRIEPLIEELERARDEAVGAAGAPRGLLRLTASVTFGQRWIVPLLGRFTAQHPGLQVACVFTDANVDLVADRIDLAIRLAPEIEGDLVAAKLMETRYAVVASPGYLASHEPLSVPADLARHRCLLFPLKPYRTRWLFKDAAGDVETIPIAGDITLSPAGALLDAAIEGLGPTLLPDWLTRDAIREGRLVDVFPHHRAAATTFDTGAWLVYPTRSYLPNNVRVMMDFLKAEARRNGP